jgi:uncharacterized membrane protein YfcA
VHSRPALLLLLGIVAATFIAVWRRQRASHRDPARPSPASIAIGTVTDFLDTLGIGSFAPTTALLRFLHLAPDRLIPGTLNVGHALPTVTQALIFIAIVEVETRTLVLMIAAAVGGAWLGAGVVAGLSRRRVQLGMGVALLVAAAILLRQLLEGSAAGAGTRALTGWALAAGVGGNVVLGMLMTLGIGLYAPCMILVTLLGMDAKAAFPIMMGSCAFLMPVAGMRFIRRGAYSGPTALGLTIGGVPAVLVAAFVVRSLSLDAVRVLVLVVVVYTAIGILRAARESGAAPSRTELEGARRRA